MTTEVTVTQSNECAGSRSQVLALGSPEAESVRAEPAQHGINVRIADLCGARDGDPCVGRSD